MSEIGKPDFVHPDVDVQTLDSGSFCTVLETTNIPDEIADRVTKDYVVKLYNFPLAGRSSSRRDAYESMLYDIPEDVDRLDVAIMDKAQHLKGQHQRMKEFFDEKMPDFVVPTTFIVAKNKQGEEGIYELQKKVDEKKFFKMDVRDFLKLSRSQQEALVAQIETLKQLVEAIRDGEYFDDHLPDMNSSNLLVSNEARLHYIDTNSSLPVRNKFQRRTLIAGYQSNIMYMISGLEDRLVKMKKLMEDPEAYLTGFHE